MMLAVYRVGCHIPVPGVDGAALSAFFSSKQNTLFGMFDMFTGGAFSQFSLMALGIMPYISASIILELMTVVVPHLERLKKEGEQGRKKITQYTRYGTVILCMVQGFGIAFGLERMTSPGGVLVVPFGGMAFRIITMITLTAGTSFLMWLGEQITERGIGNGISLIIFSGIVSGLAPAVGRVFNLIGTPGYTPFFFALVLALMLVVIGFIVFVERGQRRIPVQYAKRMVGRKMYGGQSSHLPLKVNTAGVIPPIFASSIMMFPTTIAQFGITEGLPWFDAIVNSLVPGKIVYTLLYVLFIIFFCYFYTAVHFNPVDVADNMKKSGGFVPGIRPGKNTAAYIDRVLTRLTFSGAIYVAAICLLPDLLRSKWQLPFYFGGTSLLIIVGVAMDTTRQIESHMLTRHYESFMKKGFGKKK